MSITSAPDQSSIVEALRRHLTAVRDSLPTPELRGKADELLSIARDPETMPVAAQEAYRVEIEAFCFANDLEDVLTASGVIHPYNYRKRYPQDEPQGPFPDHPTVRFERTWSLLGHRIGFPIGVPASVLTSTSKWIEYFANQGFNVLTYKTVRARYTPELDPPNWVFLADLAQPLPLTADRRDVVAHGDRDTYLQRLYAFSTANSFGVPSWDPDVWREDFRHAQEVVGEGKLLILSVMGSKKAHEPLQVLRDDFIAVVDEALKESPSAIELNLSCPNKPMSAADGPGVERPLCETLKDTVEVVQAVADKIGGAVPIVAKLSYLPFAELEQLVGALHPFVQAFSGINTLQVRVERDDGSPTFPAGENHGARYEAGLSGIAIRHFGVDFVRSLERLRYENEAFDYDIIGMGGVMAPADVDALLWVGADAVQTATAASVNPTFPAEVAASRTEHHPKDEEGVARIRKLLYAPGGSFRTARELGHELGLDADVIERELNPEGELDLPRRYFELVSVLHRYGDGSTGTNDDELRPEDWGPEPTEEEFDEAARLGERLLKGEHEWLIEHAATIEQIAAALGATTDDVESVIRAGDLVTIENGGELLVPLWQLGEDQPARILPGIRELWRAFGGDTAALSAWATMPNAHLKGRTPHDALAAGEVDAVIDAVASIGATAF